MATVVRRTIRSSPHRDTGETWDVITELLSTSSNNARKELQSIAGIAASIISEGTLKTSPIVVTCDGPRTRVYCTYNDDAIDGSGANESALTYDALKGDWRLSLPCNSDDLDWVNEALKEKSERISARDENESSTTKNENAKANNLGLELDTEGFANL